jgi:hypothetical protein
MHAGGWEPHMVVVEHVIMPLIKFCVKSWRQSVNKTENRRAEHAESGRHSNYKTGGQQQQILK